MQEPSSINYSKVIKSLYIIGALFIITYIITLSINLSQESATKAGSIGDALGGLANPFIGTMGVVLTFFAFWVQFEANERQRKDIQRERFENKFYELLRLHKENVNEIEINEVKLKGRPCFPSFLKEIYAIHSIIDHYCDKLESIYFQNFDDRIKFSFNLFYNGVTGDRINSKLHKSNIKLDDNSLFIQKILEAINVASFRLRKDYYNNIGGPDEFDSILKDLKDMEFDYKPFIGHGAQLGHYFRHLYQMVKFVDQSQAITMDQKKNYLKTLRAQLSNHEQAILYLNSLVNPGNKLWYDKNDETGEISRYIIDYKLIKNLPFHLVDFTTHPKEKLKQELKKAYPNKDEKWHMEYVNNSFEELENQTTPP